MAFENNLKNLVFVHVDEKATYLASVFSEIKKERLILLNGLRTFLLARTILLISLLRMHTVFCEKNTGRRRKRGNNLCKHVLNLDAYWTHILGREPRLHVSIAQNDPASGILLLLLFPLLCERD